MQALFEKGARFGLIGLMTVGVYFVVLAALRPVIGSVVILSGLAYLLSAVFNYVAQARFTFNAQFANGPTLCRYLAMHASCIMLNSLLMFALVERLGMGLFAAQCLVTCVIAAKSFTISHLWVYRNAS